METFKLASGIGASCVLQLPQSTPGLLTDLNSWQDPAYDPSCQWLIDLQQKVETIPILTEESNQTDFTPLGEWTAFYFQCAGLQTVRLIERDSGVWSSLC